MAVEKSVTRRPRPVALARFFWVPLVLLQLLSASLQTAASQLLPNGPVALVGAHGELQGLAYHWEMWSFAMGGMTPVEVLRAATIDGARIIGVEQDLGSIEVGKLADMVVLNSNPLDDIRNTVDIDRVLINGRLYNGDTMNQEWPDRVPLPDFWWWDQTDRRFVPDPIHAD